MAALGWDVAACSAHRSATGRLCCIGSRYFDGRVFRRLYPEKGAEDRAATDRRVDRARLDRLRQDIALGPDETDRGTARDDVLGRDHVFDRSAEALGGHRERR